MARLAKKGYGQLELNNAAFRRDGRIEAQCKLDADEFASVPAENGMILAVDRAARTVHLPSAYADGMIYMINYSAEHLYDERAMGLKDFALTPDEFLPRLGILDRGDKFTTNTVELGSLTLDTIKQGMAADTPTVYYAGVNDDGYWAVSTTQPEDGPVLRVVEVTTMPDGQDALRFICIGE